MAKRDVAPLVARAEQYEAAGKYGLAETDLLAAIKRDRRNTVALTRLARLYIRRLHTSNKAGGPLADLLAIDPKLAIAHELAAEANYNINNLALAEKHADEAVRLAPKSPDGLYVAATVYNGVERYTDAIACMNTALKVRPDHLPSRLLSAESHRAAGNLAEAESICRAVLAEYPDSLETLALWSQTCKQTADDPIYLHIRDSIAPKLREMGAPKLRRVLQLLGKAENDIGNYDLAFAHFAEAKSMDKDRHDRGVNRVFVNTMIRGISKANFFGMSGHDSESPLLIVGMPRTGSTMLEQILSNHPQIGGIGESSLLRRLSHQAGFKNNDGAKMVELLKGLSPDKAREYAQQYLDESRARHPDALRIVDKSLHNFELLAFFGRLFPKARVLNALRDPMDNCVSCYMQPLNKFHSYTQDLISLGQYYTEFRSLMTHWKSVVPNPILEVPYEDVVADTEGMARKVIDFIGLDWDPACLDFQNNEQRAKTLSVWQVRQPVYKTSVKRWKRYEAHLDPLKKELAAFYPDGF